MKWLLLLPIIPALIMAVSDFRHRTISVLWLAVFGVAAIAGSLITQGAESFMTNSIINVLVLALMAAAVYLYLTIKNDRAINPTKEHIGLGDILFILLLTPMFGVREFLVFLISSFCVALLWALAVKLIAKREFTIPLVGVLGITFLVYQLIVFL